MFPFRTFAIPAALWLGVGCQSASDPQASFEVDASIAPRVAMIDGVNPGETPRPVGSILTEDGVQSDFVQDEISIVAASAAEIQPLLERYNGTIVGQVEIRSQGLFSFLVRIDPSIPDPSTVAQDLASTNPDEQRSFAVDSDDSLGLLAAVAHEAREFGNAVDVNWILEDADIASGSTAEAPSGTGSWDEDAFTWTYFEDGGNQDFGVTAAWELLLAAGRLDADVPILVVDNGFIENDDYPLDSVVSNLSDWDAPNSGASTHGAHVVVAAMGRLDNGYGAAGPAAPVGSLIATQRGGDVWSTTQRMRTAIDTFEPRIATMSHTFSVAVDWVPFGPGFLPELDASTALYYDFAAEGIAMFGAAGNDSAELSSAFGTTSWRAPCQVGVVMCVGGLGWNSTNRAGGSNFSDVPDRNLVELWGPFTVWSVADATQPNLNQADTVSGTSFATPFVAGVAALVMAADPALSSDAVRSLLTETAQPAGAGADPRVDAQAAVAFALDLPTVEILEPNDGLSVPLGTEIVFEARAEGQADVDYQVVWDLAGELELTNEGGFGTHTLFYDELPPGTHTITASVQENGTTVSDSIEVTIEYDGFDLFILSPNNNAVAFSNEVLPLVGHSSANPFMLPDSNVVWRMVRDGVSVFTDTGHTTEVPAHIVDEGTYLIEFSGSDDVTAFTRDIVLNVIDKPDNFPTATITLPNNGNSWIGPEIVEFQGFASDPDDGVVGSERLRWTAIWSGGQIDLCTGFAWPGGSGTCGFFEAELRDLAAGGTTYTILMEAMDDDGNVDTDQVGVTIDFAPVP
ncbi:MAG: S8 family serine peptidase [Myxococcota bacterium]